MLASGIKMCVLLLLFRRNAAIQQ
uniref:Uncharacterized protein n=1 Tax=Arundo donax TaxID=35708 RepID=A0A0A9AZE2_ARUDO